MLDIKKIRENPEYYIAETEKKYTTVSLERRPLLTEVERLKSERNAQSKKIGELKKKGENADEAQAATRELGNKIDELDKKLKELDYKQTEMLMHVPNIAPRSPEGKDSSDTLNAAPRFPAPASRSTAAGVPAWNAPSSSSSWTNT